MAVIYRRMLERRDRHTADVLVFPRNNRGLDAARMTLEANEAATLAGLTRALLDTGRQAVPLGDIFEGAGRRMPSSVLLEVLERLAGAGLVRREAAVDSVVQLVGGGGRALAASSASGAGVAFEYAITEAGFDRHRAAEQAEAVGRLKELPRRVMEEQLTARDQELWAELHDYLSWRDDRTVHLANYALAHRLSAEDLRRFRESMFRIGLLERAQIETHVRLTALGRAARRI